MSDQFTEVTTKSWGGRIMNSIKQVLVGFLMFIVSFGVLYWNEGRIDVSEIAKKAVEISSTSQSPAEANQQLISATGVLESNEKIGDSFLREGNYIVIERNAEMYAWKEKTQSKSKKNTGGSETTETTYTYDKEWTANPMDSANFKKPEGHQNPPMALNSTTVTVNSAKLGIYDVDINQVALPQSRAIQLNNNNTILSDNLKLANDQYLFQGKGTVGSPELGDIRISYAVVNNPLNTATIFGKLDAANKQISPYYGTKNTKLYRIFEGTRDTAISTMKTEYSMLTWILRLVGFLLMWFGLMMLFGPISVFLDVLPIFGSIGRTGIGLITFVVSLVLSIITILVSMIVHSLLVLIIVILVSVVGTVLYLKNKRKNQSSTATNI